jgi:hypothetical protein
MSELEFVWVQQCAVCGHEHRHIEHHCVGSEDEAAAEAGAFHARCAHWYQAHVARVEARRPLPVRAR